MSNSKPILCFSHPRACSTVFERIFLHHPEVSVCFNELIGNAFWHGPEAMSPRFADKEKGFHEKSELSTATYKEIVHVLLQANEKAKQTSQKTFNKDFAKVIFPCGGQPTVIAPSFNASAEDDNPTVIPIKSLEQIHPIFLIRHPRNSVPSFYRLCIAPYNENSGFTQFYPEDVGYHELRRLFDFFCKKGIVGSQVADDRGNGEKNKLSPLVIDANDLLDNQDRVMKAVCQELGISYDPSILQWAEEEKQAKASEVFKNWGVWHNVALASKGLVARTEAAKMIKSRDQEDMEWLETYGEKGQRIIRDTVDENLEDYEYLKSFAIRITD